MNMKPFTYTRIYTFLLVLLTFIQGNLAQTPTHYPTGNDPVRWSAVNIIVYIVIPVALVVIWIILRRRKTKKTPNKNGD